jgi:hypothetical protein
MYVLPLHKAMMDKEKCRPPPREESLSIKNQILSKKIVLKKDLMKVDYLHCLFL